MVGHIQKESKGKNCQQEQTTERTSNIIGVQGSNDHIALLFHMQNTVHYAPPKALFEVFRPPSYDWVSTLHQHLRGALGEANKALD